MDTRRSVWWLLWAACCSIRAIAAETNGYQSWVERKTELMGFAGGPTGYYAIQDMQELNPGERVSLLASKDIERIRWSKRTDKGALAQVDYANHKAMIRGPGITAADLLQLPDRQIELANHLFVRVSLIHDTSLKVWLYNPKLVAERRFKSLSFFDYNPRGVVKGTFRRFDTPQAVSYLDSREEQGTMYVVGTFQVDIDGRNYGLKAYSYQKSWPELEFILLLLKDRTSGKTTYGGGRVAEVWFPKGAPPETMTVDFNRDYSFLCAHSNFYNCPIALTDYIDTELNYGERYPPVFASSHP